MSAKATPMTAMTIIRINNGKNQAGNALPDVIFDDPGGGCVVPAVGDAFTSLEFVPSPTELTALTL